MTSRFIFILLLLCMASACKTVSINQETYRVTSDGVLLGSIGIGKDYVLEEDYTSTAFIEYQKSIKLSSSILRFTKKTYRLFIEASSKQSNGLGINYIDSLVQKPKFVQLSIADKVIVMEQLNNSQNEKLNDYLKIQPEANLITSISLALNQENLNQLQNAESVFLTQSGYKRFVIEFYKKKELIGQIEVNEGVVFAYETSSFCWKENNRRQLQVVDIVNGDPCPKRTYSKSRKAKKEENYFKF